MYSDVPIRYWGYSRKPTNWLEEMRELSRFLAITDGDDKEVLPDDGATPDGGQG
jgi:hypothetical protein